MSIYRDNLNNSKIIFEESQEMTCLLWPVSVRNFSSMKFLQYFAIVVQLSVHFHFTFGRVSTKFEYNMYIVFQCNRISI